MEKKEKFLSFRTRSEVLKIIQKLAKKLGISVSEVARMTVEAGIPKIAYWEVYNQQIDYLLKLLKKYINKGDINLSLEEVLTVGNLIEQAYKYTNRNFLNLEMLIEVVEATQKLLELCEDEEEKKYALGNFSMFTPSSYIEFLKEKMDKGEIIYNGGDYPARSLASLTEHLVVIENKANEVLKIYLEHIDTFIKLATRGALYSEKDNYLYQAKKLIQKDYINFVEKIKVYKICQKPIHVTLTENKGELYGGISFDNIMLDVEFDKIEEFLAISRVYNDSQSKVYTPIYGDYFEILSPIPDDSIDYGFISVKSNPKVSIRVKKEIMDKGFENITRGLIEVYDSNSNFREVFSNNLLIIGEV